MTTCPHCTKTKAERDAALRRVRAAQIARDEALRRVAHHKARP